MSFLVGYPKRICGKRRIKKILITIYIITKQRQRDYSSLYILIHLYFKMVLNPMILQICFNRWLNGINQQWNFKKHIEFHSARFTLSNFSHRLWNLTLKIIVFHDENTSIFGALDLVWIWDDSYTRKSSKGQKLRFFPFYLIIYEIRN